MGEKLLGEAKGNTVISYLYGANGIEGILVDRHGETASRNAYAFEKNIFGDVIAIYDEDGGLCYRYTYDAWGNHRIYDGSTLIYDSATGVIAAGYESHIAILNPIRYRGYYYDTETQLFYCNSRYYDPKIGRFISLESFDNFVPEIADGVNGFTFCSNNPLKFESKTNWDMYIPSIPKKKTLGECLASYEGFMFAVATVGLATAILGLCALSPVATFVVGIIGLVAAIISWVSALIDMLD